MKKSKKAALIKTDPSADKLFERVVAVLEEPLANVSDRNPVISRPTGDQLSDGYTRQTQQPPAKIPADRKGTKNFG